jgi:hypothetical protein
MEYLIGSAFTFLCLYLVIRFISIDSVKQEPFRLRYSQSHIHSIVSPLLPPLSQLKKPLVSQATKHYDSVNVKVIILGHTAFWIKNNVFYTANIDEDGIDKDSTKIVDTMSMDKVQLDKMLFILDQLRDGEVNDSGSSGDQ